MTKTTLTQQLVETEHKIEQLNQQLSRYRAKNAALGTAYTYLQESIKAIKSLQKQHIKRSTARIRQIKGLEAENDLLRQQNADLLDRVFSKL